MLEYIFSVQIHGFETYTTLNLFLQNKKQTIFRKALLCTHAPVNKSPTLHRAGIELATPGSAVRHASVARHVTVCSQPVTCLATDACLTADPRVASSIPARSHTFMEIDHEIISTVILLPSADSFKKGCCQLQAKVCAQITG